MSIRIALGACLLAAAVSTARAGEVETFVAEGGCPVIEHAPVFQVVRGTPAIITATIACPGGQLTEVLLQVRVTDLGQPTAIKMTGKGDGLYQATVPVSLVQGITRFWYYIDTKGRTATGEESILQTGWKPVNIIQHGALEKGAAAAAGAAGGTSGGGGGNAGLYLIAGAVAVAGGVAIAENNSGSSGGGSGGKGEVDPLGDPPGGGGGKKNVGSKPPPCKLSGNESANLFDTSPCGGFDSMKVAVCGFCPKASVSVVASWGPVRQRTFDQAIPCAAPNPPVFSLPFPDGFPSGPEVETISVIVNGVLIRQFRWPSVDEYYDCD